MRKVLTGLFPSEGCESLFHAYPVVSGGLLAFKKNHLLACKTHITLSSRAIFSLCMYATLSAFPLFICIALD